MPPHRLVFAPTTIVGYHGCTEASAKSILETNSFLLSRKEYDWLGEGFYFFEYAPHRAWEWAQSVAQRDGGSPAVIEATITLGKCINLLDTAHMQGLPAAYDLVQEQCIRAGLRLPRNTPSGAHFLDQEVINLYCEVVEETSTPHQTVRGCFPVGLPIYIGSKILQRTHVQIAVRDITCIANARQVLVAELKEEL